MKFRGNHGRGYDEIVGLGLPFSLYKSCRIIIIFIKHVKLQNILIKKTNKELQNYYIFIKRC
jgi:hypothetical protein